MRQRALSLGLPHLEARRHHRIPGPPQLGQLGRGARLQKTTRVEGRPWRTPGERRIDVELRQLLEQQPVAQARLRQPADALRTYILTHRALPILQLYWACRVIFMRSPCRYRG